MLTRAFSKGCILQDMKSCKLVNTCGYGSWVVVCRYPLNRGTLTVDLTTWLHVSTDATGSIQTCNRSTRRLVPEDGRLDKQRCDKTFNLLFSCSIGVITTYSTQKSKGTIKSTPQLPTLSARGLAYYFHQVSVLPAAIHSDVYWLCDVTGTFPCEARTQIPQFCSQLDSKSKTMAGATVDMQGQGCCLFPLLHPFSH
jgi:hypothetical protein